MISNKRKFETRTSSSAYTTKPATNFRDASEMHDYNDENKRAEGASIRSRPAHLEVVLGPGGGPWWIVESARLMEVPLRRMYRALEAPD